MSIVYASSCNILDVGLIRELRDLKLQKEEPDENILSDNSGRNRNCSAPEKKDCQSTSQVVA
jgi:hypothetical protein